MGMRPGIFLDEPVSLSELFNLDQGHSSAVLAGHATVSVQLECDLLGQSLWRGMAFFATGSLVREACSTCNILYRLAEISEILQA